MIRLVIGQSNRVFFHLGDTALGSPIGLRLTNLVSSDVYSFFDDRDPENYTGRNWYKDVTPDAERFQQGMHMAEFYTVNPDDSIDVRLTQYAYILNASGNFLENTETFQSRTFDLQQEYYIAPDL